MERAEVPASALVLPPESRLSNFGLMTILDFHKQKINKRAFARFQKNKSESLQKLHIAEVLRQDDLIQYENVTRFAGAMLIRPGFRLNPEFVPFGQAKYKKVLDRQSSDDEGRASAAVEVPLVNPAKSQSQIIEAIDHETGEIKGFTQNKATRKYDELKGSTVLRQERFLLQKVSRSILKGETRINEKNITVPVFRVCDCHRNPVSTAAGVTILKGSKGAKFNGLQQCGSVWTCPVCSAKISEFRRGQIREMADVWQKSGKGLIFVTNTIRHGRNDDLRLLLEALTGDVYNRYINHRAYKTARKELGYIGRVRALEVTHGDANGWHPHIHEIWFIEKTLSALELANLQKKLVKIWNTTLVKAGFPSVTSQRGLTVQNASNASDYIAKFGNQPKWDIGHEMTKNHSKKALSEKGSTPFDLLRRSASGDTYASALFKEYAIAFFSKRQLFYSHGLKEFFQVKHLTDDEILALKDPSEVPILKINNEDWRFVRLFGSVSIVLDFADSVNPTEGIKNYLYYLRKTSLLR